ncbi:hypothetical protein KEM56_002498 [Ascosphaera pollenicola]|nr:hypothetical protein KEM56_002498 [Ascosphaera pollenicola]
MVNRILREHGDNIPIGKHWTPGFYKRNPEIASLHGVRMDNKRVEGTQPDVIKAFYERFKETKQKFKVKSQNI